MKKNIINILLVIFVVVLFFLILNDSSFYNIKFKDMDNRSLELINKELNGISNINKLEELDLEDMVLQRYTVLKNGEEKQSLVAYNKSLFSNRYKLGQRLIGFSEDDFKADLSINGNIYVYSLNIKDFHNTSLEIEKVDNRLNGRIFTLGILVLFSLIRYIYNIRKKSKDIIEL